MINGLSGKGLGLRAKVDTAGWARRCSASLAYLKPEVVRGLLEINKADRGRERYRRAGLTASTSIISQGMTMLISLVSIPLTIHYLGEERYGIWLTLTSLLTWLAMTDFGITGNALINIMAEAHGADDRQMARERASSALLAVLVPMAVMAMLFVAFFNRVPWLTIFRASSRVSIRELRDACGLAFAVFLLSYPLNMLNSLYSAYQDGYVANLWTILSNCLALCGLLVVTRFRGGLPILVLAVSGIRVLAGLASAYYLYFHRYPWLRPSVHAVRFKHIKRLFTLGSKYFVAQLSALGIGQSQPLIITQVLGPAAVPAFIIPYRLITLPQSLVFLTTAPLVPAYAEAKARMDWDWVRRAFKRSLLASLVTGFILILLMTIAARPVIRAWFGASTVPGTTLLLWLGVYAFVSIAVIPSGQMLWGLERVGVQAAALALCAVLTVRMGIGFARAWGLPGLALSMSLSSGVTLCAGQIYELRRTFKSQSARETAEPSSEAISV